MVDRKNNRKPDELRPLVIKVGVIKEADGSALVSLGKTTAIAAVYGPRTMFPRHMQISDRAVLKTYYNMIPFSTEERVKPGPSRRSQEISKVTRHALEPAIFLEEFPKSIIEVFIDIIEADAGTRTAGINAASLALAHAGLPMIDLVSSISVGKIGGKICVDLTKEEEDYEEKGKKDSTDIPFTVLPRLGQVSLLQLDGRINDKELKEALKVADNACKEIYEIQKKVLKEALKDKK